MTDAPETVVTEPVATLPMNPKTPAWMSAGKKITPDAEIEQWMDEADLNWTAMEADVKFESAHDGNDHEFPRRKVLYRSDTLAPLSIVSDRYHPAQPKEVLGIFKHVATQLGDFKLDYAGHLRGGNLIWALARSTSGGFSVKDDGLERYLLMATTFDLTMPTCGAQLSYRPSCMNVLRSLGRGQGAVRISHKKVFDADFAASRLAFDQEWKEMQEKVVRMSEIEMDETGAREFFYDIYFPPKLRKAEGFSEAAAKRKVDRLVEIFQTAPGQSLDSARGTLWGGVNAITYFVDHEARSRTEQHRLMKSWFDEGDDIKTRAFDLAWSSIN